MARRRDSLASSGSQSSIKSTASMGRISTAASNKKASPHKVSMVKKYQCSFPGCTFERNGKKHNIERHVWLQHIRKTLSKALPYSAQSHRDLVKNWIVLVTNRGIPQEIDNGGLKPTQISLLKTHSESGIGDCQHSNDSGFEQYSRADSTSSSTVSTHEQHQVHAVHMDAFSDWDSCDELTTPRASTVIAATAGDNNTRKWPGDNSNIHKVHDAICANTTNVGQSPGLSVQSVKAVRSNRTTVQVQDSIPWRDREPHWKFDTQRVGGYHYEDPCGYFASDNEFQAIDVRSNSSSECPTLGGAKHQQQQHRPSSRHTLTSAHDRKILWRPFVAL
ncbi:hypothetical protein SARC_01351 [Sphaeroforma arctica JP610]|uniref:Uncharacterized protein n=1 Tax=Sphaeroforma arctica JP610 TaxID=667725 RepID=A0A0L0GE36_9EUKA|nr:hypothetical protein SARC_01351 [Sphaeroforma arctica JP610]KNC86523.1 hypothetical protein SARC_01351 [Sphaeroforma arctica JP610]|eukprot:XP_014160425.1 hypothetical protein SARC_01351 [Sphaeroforma arctica JP610]